MAILTRARGYTYYPLWLYSLGLFVLMHKHNLEYPHFYSRLYALLGPGMLDGDHRTEFANELQVASIS